MSEVWPVCIKALQPLTGGLTWQGKHLQWKRRKKNLTDFFWRKVSFINRLLALNLTRSFLRQLGHSMCFQGLYLNTNLWSQKNSPGFPSRSYDFFFFPFLSCSGSFEFKFLKPSMSFWQRILVSTLYTCFLFQGQWNVHYVVTHNK